MQDHIFIKGARENNLKNIDLELPRQLTVDMAGVSFMDSSGLGLIMGRYATMKDIGGELYVTDPSPRVQKIMSLAGMERVINISYTTGAPAMQASKPKTQKKRGTK